MIGARDDSLLQNVPDRLWGPTSLLLNANRGSFLGVNWPGCEVCHSSSSSADVKNAWGYMCVFPLIYSYVTVCRFCAVSCLIIIIIICFYLLFSNYSTYVFNIVFIFVFSFCMSVFLFCYSVS